MFTEINALNSVRQYLEGLPSDNQLYCAEILAIPQKSCIAALVLETWEYNQYICTHYSTTFEIFSIRPNTEYSADMAE